MFINEVDNSIILEADNSGQTNLIRGFVEWKGDMVLLDFNPADGCRQCRFSPKWELKARGTVKGGRFSRTRGNWNSVRCRKKREEREIGGPTMIEKY